MVRFGGHQDRHEAQGVTVSVKILQIQRVVHHLVDGARAVVLRAHFKFKDEDDAVSNDDRIDPLTHPRDGKFQGDPAIDYVAKPILKKRNLFDPGIALEGIEVMPMPSGEMAEDGLGLLFQKPDDRGGVYACFMRCSRTPA